MQPCPFSQARSGPLKLMVFASTLASASGERTYCELPLKSHLAGIDCTIIGDGGWPILLLPACSARPLRVAILSLPACTDFRTIANGLCIHSLPPSCLASSMRVAILVTSRMRRRLTFMTALSGTRGIVGAHHLGISFRNDIRKTCH